jgi:hypothetical protein
MAILEMIQFLYLLHVDSHIVSRAASCLTPAGARYRSTDITALPCALVWTRTESMIDATEGLLLDTRDEPTLLLPEVKSSIVPALTLIVALCNISLNETGRMLSLNVLLLLLDV